MVSGVYQWCGDEELTKYGMVKIMGEQLGLDTSHVVGNAEKPPEGGVKRPRDTTMDRYR